MTKKRSKPTTKVAMNGSRLEWWTPQPRLFNYREIATNGEVIGGGANQGFSSWANLVKNIQAQATNKGIVATVNKDKTEVQYSSGAVLPLYKVNAPTKANQFDYVNS